VVIGDLMRAAATQALDGAVFSTTAASTTRPAGILNGVSAIAATGGGGAAAMLADIDALISAIVTAGGGRSIMFFASPGRAVRLRALAGIDLGLPITPTPTLTGTTLVAVEAGGFASGFGSDPNISIAAATALHFESSAPQAIGLSGSTTVPVRSLWQMDMMALRLLLDCAWTMRAPGLAQHVDSVTW